MWQKVKVAHYKYRDNSVQACKFFWRMIEGRGQQWQALWDTGKL